MFGRAMGAALCVLSFGICAATAETVRFAFRAFPPFVDVQSGKTTGLFVDLLRAVGDRVGIEIEFVPVPFEQVQGTLTDGRADAIFPLGITSERRVSFDFTDAFLMTGGALYVRVPQPTPENLAALSGKILVTPRTGPLAALIQKNAPGVKLQLTADYEESLARLIDGRADAAALNIQVGAALAKRLYPGQITIPRAMFSQEGLAIAVRKGQKSELLTRLALRGEFLRGPARPKCAHHFERSLRRICSSRHIAAALSPAAYRLNAESLNSRLKTRRFIMDIAIVRCW
jgi:polar amino acid transport system substrate-binding protein